MNTMNTMTAKNNIDPSAELPKVEKMLFKLAWKCSETYPVTFEEALGVFLDLDTPENFHH